MLSALVSSAACCLMSRCEPQKPFQGRWIGSPGALVWAFIKSHYQAPTICFCWDWGWHSLSRLWVSATQSGVCMELTAAAAWAEPWGWPWRQQCHSRSQGQGPRQGLPAWCCLSPSLVGFTQHLLSGHS